MRKSFNLARVLGTRQIAKSHSYCYQNIRLMSDNAKKAAAFKAVDEHFPFQGKAVGIGSGSTVVFVVERIKQLKKEGKFKEGEIVFVPTGFQSKQLVVEAGLTLGSVEQFEVGELDVVFDGADEVDSALNCIKGGGACLFQEKLVGQCSRKFVIVADYRKRSEKLGTSWTQGIPVEVVPMAYAKVRKDLINMGAKKVTLRDGGKAKAGPIVTDNGNFILDADFGHLEPSLIQSLDNKIKLLVGVVENGLFSNGVVAYFGEEDGSVLTKSR